MTRTKLSRSLAICAATALALALAGCDNGASPGGGGNDQVVITVTNLPNWMNDNPSGAYLRLVTTGPTVHHAWGRPPASIQNNQATWRTYVARDMQITNEPFASAGPFEIRIGDTFGWLGTFNPVGITEGSQSMAFDPCTACGFPDFGSCGATWWVD